MINNKERFVAKSPYMAKVLLRYYTFRQGFFEFKQIQDHLFLPRAGKPLTVVAVERVVRMAGETAKVSKNIRCAPHTCRHYFAQCQLQNGNDVYSVSRLLGNSCNGSFRINKTHGYTVMANHHLKNTVCPLRQSDADAMDEDVADRAEEREKYRKIILENIEYENLQELVADMEQYNIFEGCFSSRHSTNTQFKASAAKIKRLLTSGLLASERDFASDILYATGIRSATKTINQGDTATHIIGLRDGMDFGFHHDISTARVCRPYDVTHKACPKPWV